MDRGAEGPICRSLHYPIVVVLQPAALLRGATCPVSPGRLPIAECPLGRRKQKAEGRRRNSYNSPALSPSHLPKPNAFSFLPTPSAF